MSFLKGDLLWTDYPFMDLGETKNINSGWKPVTFVQYDGNKYAYVKLSNGVIVSIKAGYLFESKEIGIKTLYGGKKQMATLKDNLIALRNEVMDFEKCMFQAGLTVPVIACPEQPTIKTRWLRWNGEQITIELKGEDEALNIKEFDSTDLYFAIPLLKVLHNNAVDAFNHKSDELVNAIIEVRKIKSECFGDK